MTDGLTIMKTGFTKIKSTEDAAAASFFFFTSPKNPDNGRRSFRYRPLTAEKLYHTGDQLVKHFFAIFSKKFFRPKFNFFQKNY